ncbi:hypothetical protein BJV78DRAFT_1354192 [Lactifluus subvellereus]|nr:hypothetical protein BJV78DRAFT_1354192 [Lactifluus subvellereus]
MSTLDPHPEHAGLFPEAQSARHSVTRAERAQSTCGGIRGRVGNKTHAMPTERAGWRATSVPVLMGIVMVRVMMRTGTAGGWVLKPGEEEGEDWEEKPKRTLGERAWVPLPVAVAVVTAAIRRNSVTDGDLARAARVRTLQNKRRGSLGESVRCRPRRSESGWGFMQEEEEIGTLTSCREGGASG